MGVKVTELKVLVIGAGDMGRRHALHWQQAGAKVALICDPDLARAKASAQAVGAEACKDAKNALKRPDIQVVSVCVPSFLHADLSILAMEQGKHVLCEKPVALTIEDARAMQEAANKHNRLLRIGFMRRFDVAWPQLQTYIKQLSSPIVASATITAGIRPKRLMHDAKGNGGPILDMCCHVFDQWAQLFSGPPSSIQATGFTFAKKHKELASIRHKALDTASIHLQYPDKSVGHIQVSWGLPAGIAPVEVHTYLGPKGLVRCQWPDTMSLETSEGVASWQSKNDEPWRAEIKAFYKEILSNEPQGLASIEEGITALKTSLSIIDIIQNS